MMGPTHPKEGGRSLCGALTSSFATSMAQDEDEELEALKMQAPIENGNQTLDVYSKKTDLATLHIAREALVYEGWRKSRDPWFWSFFHMD
jgi:hypothetical protein